MIWLIKFFHQLFNPHCEHCVQDKLENKVCESCEILKTQLEIANFEKSRILEALLHKDDIQLPVQIGAENLQPVRPRHVPWKIRKAELEENDRVQKELRDKVEKVVEQDNAISSVQPATIKSVEELERELAIEHS